MSRSVFASVLLIASLALAASSSGRDSLGSGESRPWAHGVPLSEQQQAAKIFDEANALLRDSLFVDAAAKYREAMTHWDHPAIHYNLVLALVNLDQPIEVYQQIEAAMRYGPGPLGDDKFQQAKAYKSLVEKQLAWVDIHCELAGARVQLDGQPVFTAPGQYKALVRAGPHVIIANKAGYLTRETSPQLAAGQTTTIDLQLYNTEDLTQYRRRWSTWVPWSVLGAGAAVALAGGVLDMSARSNFKSYDQAITSCGGCVPTSDVSGKLSQGHTFQSMAVVGFIAGGAAIATGATLLYLNRLQSYRVDPNALDASKPSVAVAPVIAPGTGGMVASLRF